VAHVVEMELLGVRVEMPANAPLILLQERSGARRMLPIFIGGPEAQSIMYALEGRVPPRPLTHDLLRDVIRILGAELTGVVITKLESETFYAELILVRAGEELRISARPSDAVALVVRSPGCPIWCEEPVLEQAGQTPQDDPEELVDEFREFLDHINPDDFAS
jgi:bifunctional DNase/RNase